MFILWLEHIERKFYSMLINCSKSLSIGYIKAIKFVFNEKKKIFHPPTATSYSTNHTTQNHLGSFRRRIPVNYYHVCVLEQINVTYFNQKTVTLNGFLLPLCAVTCVICVPCINSKHGNTITQIDWHVKDSWMSNSFVIQTLSSSIWFCTAFTWKMHYYFTYSHPFAIRLCAMICLRAHKMFALFCGGEDDGGGWRMVLRWWRGSVFFLLLLFSLKFKNRIHASMNLSLLVIH